MEGKNERLQRWTDGQSYPANTVHILLGSNDRLGFTAVANELLIGECSGCPFMTEKRKQFLAP